MKKPETEKEFKERQKHAEPIVNEIMDRMFNPKRCRDRLEYDTKCRRCGKLEEFGFYIDATKDSINNLKEFIQEHSESPFLDNLCTKCGKKTIQDLVAYNIFVSENRFS